MRRSILPLTVVGFASILHLSGCDKQAAAPAPEPRGSLSLSADPLPRITVEAAPPAVREEA